MEMGQVRLEATDSEKFHASFSSRIVHNDNALVPDTYPPSTNILQLDICEVSSRGAAQYVL